MGPFYQSLCFEDEICSYLTWIASFVRCHLIAILFIHKKDISSLCQLYTLRHTTCNQRINCVILSGNKLSHLFPFQIFLNLERGRKLEGRTFYLAIFPHLPLNF